MHFTAFRLTDPRLGGVGFGCAVLAIMITNTLPSFRAEAPGPGPVPPAYPDALHVVQGCFISTVAYVARFRTAFPAERAQPLTVELKRFYGMHTIALLSWQGWWWGRDEFFGVFPLDRCVDKYPDPNQLVRRAEKVLDEHADREVRAGRGEWAPRPPSTLPAVDRARYVSQAAAVLPCPSEVYWVIGGCEEIPVLFFRPSPGLICVYDALTGTGQAESDCTQTPSLVKAFAAALGYRVDDVRADLTHPAGALAWREKSRAGS